MEKQEFSSHISRRMNKNLEEVFNSILEMGGLVESQIDNALTALTSADKNRADEVIILDKTVNLAEFEIERLCANILVRQQPTASDLRLTISSIRVAIDLERIGDEVVRVARMVKTFLKHNGNLSDEFPGYANLLDITHRSQRILHSSLDCFARLTVNEALSIIDEEEEIQRLYEQAYKDIISGLKTMPESAECIAEMLLSLRSAKRVSAHIINIIENVVYLINGKDIRTMDDKSMVKLMHKMEKREKEEKEEKEEKQL